MGIFDKLFGKNGGNNNFAPSAGFTFEKRFGEILADMVAVCLEYCSNRADKIFIYGSCEEGTVTANFFYQVKGRTIHKHLLNDAFPDMPIDVSKDRQLSANDILIADMKSMGTLCEQFNRSSPTEMKIMYTVVGGATETAFKYDLVYTNTEDKFATDIFDEWFDEISQLAGNRQIAGRI